MWEFQKAGSVSYQPPQVWMLVFPQAQLWREDFAKCSQMLPWHGASNWSAFSLIQIQSGQDQKHHLASAYLIFISTTIFPQGHKWGEGRGRFSLPLLWWRLYIYLKQLNTLFQSPRYRLWILEKLLCLNSVIMDFVEKATTKNPNTNLLLFSFTNEDSWNQKRIVLAENRSVPKKKKIIILNLCYDAPLQLGTTLYRELGRSIFWREAASSSFWSYHDIIPVNFLNAVSR